MPEQRYVDVRGRLDTWYVAFSPHVRNQALNRWLEASTDEGCRHVYAFKRAGPGVLQVEASRAGAFCEWTGVSVPDALRFALGQGDRVYEWGVEWDEERMAGQLESEVLQLTSLQDRQVKLEMLRSPVYIRPGYFSCVAVVKVFLGITAPDVQKPRELMEYLQAQGAEEV